MNYKSQAFLSPVTVSGTSSITCFCSEDGKESFLEIADESSKVRIVKNADESDEDYLCKLLMIHNNVQNLMRHILLERKKKKEGINQ
jgi:hypothetical protein